MNRFIDWVRDFNIEFRNDEHFDNIYQKWLSNDKFIEEINGKNLTYDLGHNQFSGMDDEDFRKYLGYSGEYSGISSNRSFEKAIYDTSLYSLPEKINWVENGAVTEVKDQGQCGSCWSFSTTGALEGAFFIKNGNTEIFSEQQLVDCDNFKNGGRDMGCNGGLMDRAFAWIEKNGGLCSEADYPYVSGETKTGGTCQKTCNVVENSKIVSFVDVEPSSDIAMMTALTQQPVSIAIEADQREFQLYKSGIFTGVCGTKLDHGVLLVGYGTDYYLVKNSWGVSWGDGGYIKLGLGSDFNNGDGQCGMLLQGSFPKL
jgi:C1A family cysteine protease|uniref:Peptidase C1A papain C-terminal domain-containing protein n=1 Tax=viral metagenome TaxID=1070528 RepID=A0A6C0DJ36_9ZZZZ